MRPVADAEGSPPPVSKAFGPEAADLEKLGAGFERTVRVAVADEARGGAGVQAGDIGEKVTGGGVEFHADLVHAGDDHIVERALEGGSARRRVGTGRRLSISGSSFTSSASGSIRRRPMETAPRT